MLVIRNFDGSLADTSLITLLASERHGIFELRVTTSSICSDYRCYCYMKSLNSKGLSSEELFETKIQAMLDKYDEIFEQPEEELMDFI